MRFGNNSNVFVDETSKLRVKKNLGFWNVFETVFYTYAQIMALNEATLLLHKDALLQILQVMA